MWYKPGAYELLIILIIVIVVFGPRSIPALGKIFGEMIKNFKKGSKNDFDDKDDSK